MSETGQSGVVDADATSAIVDCDIHTRWRDPADFVGYLSPQHRQRGVTLPSKGLAHPHSRAKDLEGSEGWSGKPTPEETAEYLLDKFGIEYGIITGNPPAIGVASHGNRYYAADFARAHNDWLIEEWLPADDRFRASVLIAPQHPERSAELIREYGADDRFVQVIMSCTGPESYGKPMFWPIFEAAEEMALPVAIHPGGSGAGTHLAPSSSGYPSSYFEFHNALPQNYMGHVNSMILEGVFEEFPGLTFVCIEGGFGWVPHLMWRMDKNWKALRDQTPWLTDRPSEYIRRHIRFTTQPIEEPDDPEHLIQLFDMIDADRTLMFSSDYPHWDGDDPRLILPSSYPADKRRRIMSGNAAEIYDL